MKMCVMPLICVLVALAQAQEPAPPSVLLPIIVTDARHQPLAGLSPASLIISEHKTAITDFKLLNGSNQPLELGILLDTSNSERNGSFVRIVESSKAFVNKVLRGSGDRVFFSTVSTTVQSTGWMTREQIGGLSLKIGIGGGTAIYDSVALACKERMGPIDRNHPTRRLLVVVSDGEDNMSHVTWEQAGSEALTSGVVLFTLSDAKLVYARSRRENTRKVG